MDLSELNELDFNNIGNWPAAAKAVLLLVLFVAALGAGWYFDWDAQWKKLEEEQKVEEDLREKFKLKQRKAANLAEYKEQLKQMEAAFSEMLGQLPAELEVEAFVIDISQTGLASGLELELIKPSGEQTKEFYAELPVTIRAIGGYHELGEFVSGIAGLPRIVTLHNITVKPNGGSLTMDATAKTYRYISQQ